MNDLRRPTLDEFIRRARRMGVRRADLLIEEIGKPIIVLYKPTPEGPHLRVNVQDIRMPGPLPSATIVRLCRALDLKPHDFGVFVG